MFCNYVIGSLRLPATHLLYGSTSFSCRTASTRAVPMLSNSQNGIQPARTRMLPILCPFMRLNRVAGLSPVGNTHTWNIQNLLCGEFNEVILSNYMVDWWFLTGAVPRLKQVPVTILCSQGEKPTDSEAGQNVRWHYPRLPVQWGTHHSKALIAFYPTGVRIAIFTANFISPDWKNKNQAIWCQDFPIKTPQCQTTEFEATLCEYFTKTGGVDVDKLRKYDYSANTVHLVASVPGTHTGKNMHKWGHMALRRLLAHEQLPPEFVQSDNSIICQYSSQGSLSDKWMRTDLTVTMASGRTGDAISVKQPELRLVIPTVEEVRTSIEGWRAGASIPIPFANHKPFLRNFNGKDLYHRFAYNGDTTRRSMHDRERAMPHIKSYARVRDDSGALAWLLVTSANLSKAAWGELQKESKQIFIRSYELGVLFVPSLYSAVASKAQSFSCTPELGLPYPVQLAPMPSKPLLSITTNWQDSSKDICFRLPYDIPPQRYQHGDTPWSKDSPSVLDMDKDVLGVARCMAGFSHYGVEALKAPILNLYTSTSQSSQIKRSASDRNLDPKRHHTVQQDKKYVHTSATSSLPTNCMENSDEEQFRWMWKTDSGEWKEYPLQQQYQIESAWRVKTATPESNIVDIGNGRNIDFGEMRQVVTGEPHRYRRIRRENLSSNPIVLD